MIFAKRWYFRSRAASLYRRLARKEADIARLFNQFVGTRSRRIGTGTLETRDDWQALALALLEGDL